MERKTHFNVKTINRLTVNEKTTTKQSFQSEWKRRQKNEV